MLVIAASSGGSLGCGLQVHEGDGLVSDGREVLVSPTVIVDAGRGSGTMVVKDRKCLQLPLFEQYIIPLFNTKFDASPEPISCAECHDGTKPKAAAALLMGKDNAFAADDCQIALVLGATMADPLQAELLSSSDPDRPEVVHDFKFKTREAYAQFRDTLLIWLVPEKQ